MKRALPSIAPENSRSGAQALRGATPADRRDRTSFGLSREGKGTIILAQALQFSHDLRRLRAPGKSEGWKGEIARAAMVEKNLGGGPVPPYGVAIRDAIAKGGLSELKALLASIAPAVEELKAAIAALETGAGRGGPVMPYGPPIRDAIARGDVNEMKATAEAARRAIFNVNFHSVAADAARDAKSALDELEAALAKLKA